MSYGRSVQFQMPVLGGMVKKIIILNVGIWLILQILLDKMILGDSLMLNSILGLVPISIIKSFYIWQPVSYMFLHSFSPMHILFNMLLVWWIGGELERIWGSKYFLKFYMVSGIGAGILYFIGYLVYSLISGNLVGLITPVVGASGAVFGLLLAYGVLFSEREILFMFIFPMKAKYFVMLLGGLEVMYMISGTQAGVANLAHIGGLLSGYLFLWYTARKKGGKKPKTRRKAGPHLKLVVDNDKADDDGPKYWN